MWVGTSGWTHPAGAGQVQDYKGKQIQTNHIDLHYPITTACRPCLPAFMQTSDRRKGEPFAEKTTGMSVDALGVSQRRLARLPETSDSSQGQRKPSAVERLEADKAKYVKSQQVALNKQLPIIRKPLMPSSNNEQLRPGAPQPTRKVAARSASKPEAPPLNLEHLNSLINGVCDTLAPSNSLQREKPGKRQDSAAGSASQLPFPTLSAVEEYFVKSGSSPTPQMKILGDSFAANGSSSYAVTVRRVDVRPQLAIPQMRKPCRAQLPGQRVHSQLLQLLRPYTQGSPPPQPLQPIKSRHDIINISNPVKSPVSPVQTSPFSAEPLTPALTSPDKSPKELNKQVSPTSAQEPLPPPSPAVTHKSSVSSRKRRSLTRSKSDVSDRFSRAGAEVERFFNYCGLEPSHFEELTPCSDIASISRLRSASAPASECTADEEGDEEDEEAAKDEKPSYGVSVIERNARVIKWLYGMRQTKDSTKVANI
ncbi:protein FAM110A isoform X1 [Pangasianodon hypophthalmus]|uniref:protein FAM110A isoform X1 n=2 Tax=Pangasianodon hypophthalmus TaxID=310915 RepID=UPI000F00C0B6|nr:protein FAM110A isoform X1 [Pangasianodon hypophthalmus]